MYYGWLRDLCGGSCSRGGKQEGWLAKGGEEVTIEGGRNMTSDCGDGIGVGDVWQLDDKVWREGG